MATIVQERYTISDARNWQKPRKYAGVITWAAKLAELGSTSHIIMLIYNGLDLEFQWDLAMPSLTTLLEHFLQELEDHKDIWWGLALRANQPLYSSYNTLSLSLLKNARNPYYNNLYLSRDQLRFSSYASPLIGRDKFLYQTLPGDSAYWQTRNNTDKRQDSTKHSIEPPKPKLMIAAGPANKSDRPSKQADGPPNATNLFCLYYNWTNNQNCWNTRAG